MNVRPVIERELRVSARQLTTYYSRLVPTALMLAVASVMYTNTSRYMTSSDIGGQMFGILNMILVGLIWLIMPLSTADVISREKREDTLGLLLLTPLRPFEVVTSKMIGGLTRGFTLILSVLPIVAVPILLGGVTGMDLMRVALLDLAALVGAVGAGVVISSFCVRRGRAWFMAFVMAFLVSSIIYSLHLLYLDMVHVGGPRMGGLFYEVRRYPILLPVAGWFLSGGHPEFWQITGMTSTGTNVGVAGMVLGTSVLVTAMGVMIAARRVRTFSEHGQLTSRQKKIADVFTKERLFARQLASIRRRMLTRNPSAWLVQRKWTARLAKWGWTWLVVVVLTFSLTARFALDGVIIGGLWLGLFLVLTLMLLSATSLQAERDSGALELVLVTHLSPEQLINGRLNGIWKTFQPAVVTLIGVFLYTGWAEEGLRVGYYGHWPLWIRWLPYILSVMFLVSMMRWLPVIGLCFSLNRRGVLASCLNTFFFSLAIPWGGPVALFGLAMFLYRGMAGRFHASFPYATMFVVFVGSVLMFQTAIWIAAKKGKLDDFPKLLPGWMGNWKFGWFGPWTIVAGCVLFVAIIEEFNDRTPWVQDYLVLLWHITAWSLLAYFARRSRRSLLQTLTSRTFVTEN